jgi:hypothetical protein
MPFTNHGDAGPSFESLIERSAELKAPWSTSCAARDSNGT